MSAGNFLVSLKEVQGTEKTLICRSLLKEQIDSWKKGLSTKVDITPQMMDILKKRLKALMQMIYFQIMKFMELANLLQDTLLKKSTKR